MTLLADLADFLHSHRPHGPLTVDATEPAWNGYPAHGGVSVWGSCLKRWVTPQEANADLLHVAAPN